MRENITLTTLLAYISFLVCVVLILQPFHLVYCTEQNSLYWTWNQPEKISIEQYNEYYEEVLSAVGLRNKGIHSSLRVQGTFLWGSDRWELGEICGGDKHGIVL